MKSKSFNILDAKNVHQSLFLQASAGTGKTFALEHLFIRLLIESENENKSLDLEEILVVTFTNASTKELKFRIKQKIQHTLCLLEDHSEESLPSYLQELLTNEEAKVRGIQNLKRALFTFNQAQIFTLHSFCQQALQEAPSSFSFSSPVMDELYREKLQALVKDFLCFSLKKEDFHKSQMSLLLKRFKGNTQRLQKQLIEDTSPPIPLELYPSFQESMSSLKSITETFRQNTAYLALKENPLTFSKCFKGNFSKKNQNLKESVNKYLKDALLFLENDEDFEQLSSLPFFLSSHHPDKLLKKHVEDPSDLLRKYAVFHQEASKILEVLFSPEIIYMRLLNQVSKSCSQYIQKQQIFSPDQILNYAKTALKEEGFVSYLQNKYRAICIDEFQDTDPTQWEIFSTLFNTNSHLLYLVGDPKQSIYGFRQADLYTFLKANKKLKNGAEAFLNTNYRSSALLTSGLNSLFCDNFTHNLFKLPLKGSHIPYLPVNSHDSSSNEILNPIETWVFSPPEDQSLSFNEIEKQMLLPQLSKELIRLADKEQVPFHKMAILVKDRYQAARAQEFLLNLRIPCHIQDSPDLLKSSMFFAFTELIKACYFPKNLSVLKKCLANEFFQLEASLLKKLKEQDFLAKTIQQFTQLQKALIEEGPSIFLSLLNKMNWAPFNESLEDRLLSQSKTLSSYDDFIKLKEALLSFEEKNISPLTNYEDFLKSFLPFLEKLHKQRGLPKPTSPNSVNILTIHMSKGLEFDCVFPLGLTPRHKTKPLSFCLNQSDSCVRKAALSSDSNLQLFYEEQNAEKMRQLYVALTRAKKRLYLPVFLTQKTLKSPLSELSLIEGYLHAVFNYKDSSKDLENVNLSLSFEDLELAFEKQFPQKTLLLRYFSSIEEPLSFSAKQVPFEKNLHPTKGLSQVKNLKTFSYSSLKKLLKKAEQKEPSIPKITSCKTDLQLEIPRGTETGIILHSILQHLPLKNLATSTEKEIEELYVNPFIKNSNCADLGGAISKLLLKLNDASFKTQFHSFFLKEIEEKLSLKESEFLFYQDDLSSSHFIHGFYDMLFQHKGYYYLLDWKSDYLGAEASDYEKEALKSEVLQKYSIQISLYSEALYTLICSQNSQEDVQFGGIFYVYLRGLKYHQGTLYLSPSDIQALPTCSKLIKEAQSC
jgi:exodeoxyribonuclease V beta subunit